MSPDDNYQANSNSRLMELYYKILPLVDGYTREQILGAFKNIEIKIDSFKVSAN